MDSDPYANLDVVAARFEAQGYSEALSYEMAYAKLEQTEEEYFFENIDEDKEI